MKAFLFPCLLLFACASQARREPYEPPATASSPLELSRALPSGLFRGDFALRDSGAHVVFLKDEPADQVPMRVVVYARAPGGEGLVRRFVAPTPFAAGDCRRGECRARIAEMPNGFQLSRESFGADRLHADYRFALDGNDLKLTGKGFRARGVAGSEGRAGDCSLFYDYEKARVVHRVGGKTETAPLSGGDTGAKHLLADGIRFETRSAPELCAPLPRP